MSVLEGPGQKLVRLVLFSGIKKKKRNVIRNQKKKKKKKKNQKVKELEVNVGTIM